MAAKPTSVSASSDLPSLYLEHAPLPIATVEGPRHIVRYVNPAFCRLMDKPVAQLVGKPFREIVPPDDGCVTFLDSVYRTGKPESHTEQSSSNPNAGFWSYTMWPMTANEHPLGVIIQVTVTTKVRQQTVAVNEALMLGALRQHELTEASENANAQLHVEIAERKQIETALRASEERYRTLFESIDEGFCVIEMLFDENAKPVDYRFLEANPAFERQSGMHGAVGKRVSEVVPDIEAHWLEIYGNVALTGKPIRFENEASGLHAWFDVYAFRLGERESRKVAIVFNNITQRKRADQVLRASEEALRTSGENIRRHAGKLEREVAERTVELTATNKQLEAMVYSIAHDLRAPLRSMQGFSAMLVEEAGAALSETGKGYADRINKSAQFMDALLKDLLVFSRLTQHHLKLTPVNLETIVGAVISRVQNEIQEKNARVESPGPWPVVLAHAPTLTQAVLDLTSNALKFVVPDVPPLVRLRVEEDAEVIRMWVEDNGIGIAPEHQDQIFRPFSRLNGETYPGTGMGLAIVQKGIERMDGRMGVESAAGQGSRFWFELRKA